jgi:ribosomal protein S12 methylthiotransferase
LLTLGCAKNLVDSEHIASALAAAGVEVERDLREADVAVINTCGFIEPAKEEAVELILDVGARKAAGKLRALIVTGCLGQRYGVELAKLIPEADAVIGVDPEGAARLALKALGLPPEPLPSGVLLRSRRLTPKAWSYLPISYGCDNRCAYCAIPLIRGPLRSRPMPEVLAEARYLVEQGARELNVIAQDTSSYGVDTEGKPLCHALLSELCRIEGLAWVRLLYVHPAHVYDELIDVIAGEEKACPYVDMPLQHISDRVLRRMGRKVTRPQIEALIEKLRERIPGVTLRTTFMTGFPGETEEEFHELLDFVSEVRFDRVGCFAYSAEDGTRAARLRDQLPGAVRQERCGTLMAAQQEIAFELAAARAGERTLVLTEEDDPDAEGLRAARSRREAPDVDPVVYVAGDDVPAGEFVHVKIVGSAGYDCIAEVLPEAGSAR